jgi:short-subunit dehydrogenase
MELQLLDISVSVLRAGAVSTGMLGVSTRALDNFCEKTKIYQCNAERFRKIVNDVEAKNVPPEKVAEKTLAILGAKKPKFAYTLNRNKLLLLLNALPHSIQFPIIKNILKKKDK